MSERTNERERERESVRVGVCLCRVNVERVYGAYPFGRKEERKEERKKERKKERGIVESLKCSSWYGKTRP